MKKRSCFLFLSAFIMLACSSPGEPQDQLMKRNKISSSLLMHYKYDASGNPDTAGTKITHTRFNKEGLPVLEINFDSQGNEAWRDETSYDSLGHVFLVRHLSSVDSSLNCMQTYVCRPDGKPAAQTKTELRSGKIIGTVIYEYNREGNCVLQTETSLANGAKWKQLMEYDANGNLTNVAIYNSLYGENKPWRMTGMEYNSEGQLVKSIRYFETKDKMVGYSKKYYNANGLLEKSVSYDSNDKAESENRLTYTYY